MGKLLYPSSLTWQVKNKKNPEKLPKPNQPNPNFGKDRSSYLPPRFFQGKTTRVKRRFEGGNLAARKVTLNTSASQVTKVGAPNLALNKKTKEATGMGRFEKFQCFVMCLHNLKRTTIGVGLKDLLAKVLVFFCESSHGGRILHLWHHH